MFGKANDTMAENDAPDVVRSSPVYLMFCLRDEKPIQKRGFSRNEITNTPLGLLRHVTVVSMTAQADC